MNKLRNVNKLELSKERKRDKEDEWRLVETRIVSVNLERKEQVNRPVLGPRCIPFVI